MHTALSARFGIEQPIFGFSHAREVVAAVTNGGGFGVLGAARFDPQELDDQLRWIVQRVGDRPFGVDLVFPITYLGDDRPQLESAIPETHRRFVGSLMDRFAIPPAPHLKAPMIRGHEHAREQWATTKRYAGSVRLLASALGPLPPEVQAEAGELGIATAGLVGDPRHVRRHLDVGTEILIAQGTEAGGHCGEIGSLVLLPQVVEAAGSVPVLAAGGIGTGRQVAAALALGAEGVWTGSVWLTTTEYAAHPMLQRKLLAAASRDTVRSRSRTGKPVRQLRTPWVRAWESEDAPAPLKAPLQQLLVGEAMLSALEHDVDDAIGSPAGQVVGMIDRERTVEQVMRELHSGARDSARRLAAATGEPVDAKELSR